jgi:hypothetical protein
VICQVDATPAKLLNQLFNIDNYDNWVYGKAEGIIKGNKIRQVAN